MEWTNEAYQALGRKGVENLSDEDFLSLAKAQKDFCPDMLLFNTEREILEMFYRAFGRKFKGLNETK